MARDRQGRLEFRDARREPDESLPAPREDLASAMWASDPDGALSSGFAAWRRILSALPRWRWLATVAGLPPLRWVGPPAYRIVARWRHVLPVAYPAKCEARAVPEAPEDLPGNAPR
jgi:predicted DCC family thiol-disulfide oxidoreductase YuxK